MTNINKQNTIIVSELLDHLMQKLFVINFSMFSIIISMTIINTLGYSISNFKIFKLSILISYLMLPFSLVPKIRILIDLLNVSSSMKSSLFNSYLL